MLLIRNLVIGSDALHGKNVAGNDPGVRISDY